MWTCVVLSLHCLFAISSFSFLPRFYQHLHRHVQGQRIFEKIFCDYLEDDEIIASHLEDRLIEWFDWTCRNGLRQINSFMCTMSNQAASCMGHIGHSQINRSRIEETFNNYMHKIIAWKGEMLTNQICLDFGILK